MPSIDTDLVAQLSAALDLERAVETGTHLGAGARRLAAAVPEVITIELSAELGTRAAANLRDLGDRVRVRQGHSVQVLAGLQTGVATLWFLDGHWSGGPTAGRDDECPVLAELDAIRGGHARDVVIIDDARLFAAAPPPPHDPSQWPDLIQVLDVLREGWRGHLVTVINDQIIAAPEAARPVINTYAQRVAAVAQPAAETGLRQAMRSLLAPLRRA